MYTNRRNLTSQLPNFNNGVGGIRPEEGWLTVNAQAENTMSNWVAPDIQRNMNDLQGLRNNSVSAIYTRWGIACLVCVRKEKCLYECCFFHFGGCCHVLRACLMITTNVFLSVWQYFVDIVYSLYYPRHCNFQSHVGAQFFWGQITGKYTCR